MTSYTPRNFSGYDSYVHPNWDSITTIEGIRYRLIQQYQTRAVWDVSLPDKRELLGQIEWVEHLNSFKVIRLGCPSIGYPQTFSSWQDAALALNGQYAQAVA
jgi:hypothetical protein